MTLFLYCQCVLMYVIGQALHLFVLKIPSVKKRDAAANIKFSFKEYWKEEWNIIVGNQIFGLALIVGLNELLHWKPEILNAVKWFFAAVGAIGSATIMAKFSTYEKKVLSIVDVKTNIADANTDEPITKVSDVAPKP
ncbi:hypothetical protein ACX0G7_09585 [Flavitalea antarctica]